VREHLRDRHIRGLARRCLQAGKLRQVSGDRVGDIEFPLVLQHENRDAGDRLGHRRDPEQRVRRHRTFRRDIGETVRVEVEDTILPHDRGHGAGDLVFGDHRLHRGTDTGERRLCGDDDQRGGEREGQGGTEGAHALEV
jgi:hypothetical protein